MTQNDPQFINNRQHPRKKKTYQICEEAGQKIYASHYR
jgi:hypothetical protein